jgi:hypothetical protein
VLEPGVTVLDAEGAGTQNFINSMLQGSVFAIARYGSRQRMVDANGGDNPQRSVPHSPLVQSLDIHNKSTDMDDPFAEQLEPNSPEDLFSNGIENNLAQATATTGCAVCLGTGWVGGYDPVNALRVVYDTQANWSGDIQLDRTQLPNRWTLNAGTNRVASVSILWPAGAVGIEALRIWDNRNQIKQAVVWIKAGETQRLQDLDVMSLFTGQQREMLLEFGPEVTGFTHLEVQFEMAVQPVYADWSRLMYNENLQLVENLDSPSLVLSPSLPHVAMYDLVTESIYRKIWKINSSNPALDRERQINGWEVTARLLQTYELPWLLPRRLDRVWYTSNRVMQQPRDVSGEPRLNPYPAPRATQPR